MKTTYLLTIDLRDGFYNDTVVVLADGLEVYRQGNVTTRTMTGFADSMITKLKPGQHSLRVLLLEKEVSTEIKLDIQTPLYLGLEYKPQKGLEYMLQGEPFRYM